MTKTELLKGTIRGLATYDIRFPTSLELDGSDAIADWPILNALLNTASGATWVSFHHGGGVGMGFSLHAGQVTVADGTEMASRKIERVLNNDPGLGVVAFSLGGFYALQLARADPEHIRSVVLFYGTEGTMGSDFSASQADYLGHFAENDVYETQANVDRLEEALRRAGRLDWPSRVAVLGSA